MRASGTRSCRLPPHTDVGGVAVERHEDVRFRATSLSDHDDDAMIESLRGRQRFDGFRGAPPADRAALLDLLQRISAPIVPEVPELDLDPVICPAPPGGNLHRPVTTRLGLALDGASAE